MNLTILFIIISIFMLGNFTSTAHSSTDTSLNKIENTNDNQHSITSQNKDKCNLIINYSFRNSSITSNLPTDLRAIFISLEKNNIKIHTCDTSLIQINSEKYASLAIENHKIIIPNDNPILSLLWQNWILQDLDTGKSFRHHWNHFKDLYSIFDYKLLSYAIPYFQSGRRIISILNDTILFYEYNAVSYEDYPPEDEYFVARMTEVSHICHHQFASSHLTENSHDEFFLTDASIDHGMHDLGITIPTTLLDTFKRQIHANMEQSRIDHKNISYDNTPLYLYDTPLDVVILPQFNHLYYSFMFSYGNDKLYSLNALNKFWDEINGLEVLEEDFITDSPPCTDNDWYDLNISGDLAKKFKDMMNPMPSCGEIDVPNNTITINGTSYPITDLLYKAGVQVYYIMGIYFTNKEVPSDICKPL